MPSNPLICLQEILLKEQEINKQTTRHEKKERVIHVHRMLSHPDQDWIPSRLRKSFDPRTLSENNSNDMTRVKTGNNDKNKSNYPLDICCYSNEKYSL